MHCAIQLQMIRPELEIMSPSLCGLIFGLLFVHGAKYDDRGASCCTEDGASSCCADELAIVVRTRQGRSNRGIPPAAFLTIFAPCRYSRRCARGLRGAHPRSVAHTRGRLRQNLRQTCAPLLLLLHICVLLTLCCLPLRQPPTGAF